MKNPPRVVLVTLFLFPLIACGGGGGGGGDVGPTARVGFPASGSATDSSSITVSGTSTAGESAIAAVRVDGVDAASTDGFRTWSATVPLASGENVIDVAIEDANGAVFDDVARVQVRSGVLFENLLGIDFDSKTAWLVDSGAQALYSFDSSKGDVQLVSGDDRGAGVLFVVPFDVAVVPGGQTAYVADLGLEAIIEVDSLTGDREALLVSGDVPEITSLGGLEYDAATGTLLIITGAGRWVVDAATGASTAFAGTPLFGEQDVILNNGAVYVLGFDAIRRVDPNSGLSALASNPDTFTFATSMDVDPKFGLIYVADQGASRVYSVNPVTGEQQTILTLDRDFALFGLAFDEANRRLLVTDSARDAVLSVDPADGSGGRIVSDGVGRGLPLGDLVPIAGQDGRWFGLDRFGNFIAEIDLLRGDRELISGRTVGEGDKLKNIAGMALDLENGRVFVTDTGADRVFSVDLASGDRTVIALGLPGLGFRKPSSIVRHPDGKLLILDSLLKGIFELDPESGIQRVVSRNGDGLGEAFLGMKEMELDPIGGRVFVSEDSGIYARVLSVDLETGFRTELTHGFDGNGPTMSGAGGLAVDALGETLYMGVFLGEFVVAIDTATGERTLVSGPQDGRGPQLDQPDCLALDEERGQLLSFSAKHSAVLGVSLESGDRVVLSK